MSTAMDIDTPWMFNSPAKPTHNSIPALALARAGGPAVATYPTPPSSLSAKYRVPAPPPPPPSHSTYPLTPSSITSTLASNLYRPAPTHDLTCSLSRSASSASARSTSSSSSSSSSSSDIAARCGPVLPLIHDVFPATASEVASVSHMLEIVTPPNHVLHGFIADEPTLGRVVFVHLPPTHASAPTRPEVLTPGFSNVLRRDGPTYSSTTPVPPAGPVALDIRESLTALLDLADEIEGAQLVLILDKDEREPAPLAELMHALMYVGGQPVRPGALVGEWEWDARRWALVSIEL
ncbi:unnamed protein product [Cutaneotrichosporon oleaginosum]